MRNEPGPCVGQGGTQLSWPLTGRGGAHGSVEPTAPATTYTFYGKRLVAVRAGGGRRGGAGRRQERRPGGEPGRARGAERAALMA
jgi:hypothetical protein